MREILEAMYHSYGFDNVMGIAYCNKFLNELSSYRFAEIFVFQAKRYQLRYVFDFLLSTPSLWLHLSDIEWIDIMNYMNPRPYPLKLSLDNGYFADIHFLAKYIRVNSIEVFLRQENFRDLDKKYVIQYCQRDIYSLLVDEIDLEDLDGDYFVSKEEIENLQSRLTSGGIFSPFNFDEDELIDYLKTEIIVMSSS
ncbi:MAG TPA: hypothetical protein DEG17_08455 [Cyanobacteria bacterium UBA11149]|nr:hypothetical protein [Cyanobacteria bacterium UBA11366]HBS68181.1 hypothetical protein [Cyanobacteria bacterium UBA11153]HBW88890.1 hypothetical protein [Cyanobacteria bacterium UBA11149]HCA94577.1 hypothetical protein [Cyanobacteria bacterium UBA9226]